MDLFAEQRRDALRRAQPLAARMRPRRIDEFVGQAHLLAPGRPLRRLLEADRFRSAIFFGPPGSGKTSLARLIAEHTKAAFETLHAAESGVKDVRAVIEAARGRLLAGQRTILFLDEIHRFSRSQQDVLLRDVEDGVLVLIGATTENPFFAVNSPLISRSDVFEFRPLEPAEMLQLLQAAAGDPEWGVGGLNVSIEAEALAYVAELAGGDARRALNILEVAVLSEQPAGGAGKVTRETIAQVAQRQVQQYDGAGDTHYDLASALIKSMRGSDPDAALYWLARMLAGGEDPRFIARRIAICACEDVGNADPQAAVVAAAAAQISELVGMPECRYPLAQAAVYVACAPKSNACAEAISAALHDVEHDPILPVPAFLRDSNYAGAARLGRGGGYRSPHDAPGGFLPTDYLGAERRYYNPTDRGVESLIAAKLREWRAARDASGRAGETPSP